MPIRKDLQHFYGREWREKIRPRILDRDGNCCKFCGKPNHETVHQIVDRARRRMWWFNPILLSNATHIHLVDHCGRLLSTDPEALPLLTGYDVRVVLTVAHLNHDAADMRDENLAALCQWCHLNHDRGHHAQTRATRKDGQRPLLTMTETQDAA